MACMTPSPCYDDLSCATRTAHGLIARMTSVEGGGHNAYLGFMCMSEALPALHGADDGALALLGIVGGIEALVGLRSVPAWSMNGYLGDLLRTCKRLPKSLPLGGDGKHSARAILRMHGPLPEHAVGLLADIADGLHGGSAVAAERVEVALTWLVQCSRDPAWGGFASTAGQPQAWPEEGNPLLPRRRVYTGWRDDAGNEGGGDRSSLLCIVSDAVAGAWLHPEHGAGAATTRLLTALPPGEAAGVAMSALDTRRDAVEVLRALPDGSVAMLPEAWVHCLVGVAGFDSGVLGSGAMGERNLDALVQLIRHATAAAEDWDDGTWTRHGGACRKAVAHIGGALRRRLNVQPHDTATLLRQSAVASLEEACGRLDALTATGMQHAALGRGRTTGQPRHRA